MSWVAEAKASRVAHRATRHSSLDGSVLPSPSMVTMSSSCENTSQPRRWPSSVVNGGSGM